MNELNAIFVAHCNRWICRRNINPDSIIQKNFGSIPMIAQGAEAKVYYKEGEHLFHYTESLRSHCPTQSSFSRNCHEIYRFYSRWRRPTLYCPHAALLRCTRLVTKGLIDTIIAEKGFCDYAHHQPHEEPKIVVQHRFMVLYANGTSSAYH